MRRASRIRRLSLLAALALLSGCSAMHLGHGPATSAAPGTSTATTKEEKRAQKERERSERLAEKQAEQSERLAKKTEQREQAKSGNQREQSERLQKTDTRNMDPMEEARVRAAEQPDEPWWPYRMAELQAKAGRPADAEASLRASIARDSGYAPALTQLSRTLYEQGRHEEALELLAPAREGRVTMSAKERAAVLSGVALHEAALGRDAEARAIVAELPGDEAAAVSSYLAARSAKGDSSAKVAQAASRSGPESAALLNNRGIALLRAGDADAAQKAFERAIELDPSRAAPYYNLAILERWYRLDKAVATVQFKHYWSLSHADPDSLYAELGRSGPVAEEGGNK